MAHPPSEAAASAQGETRAACTSTGASCAAAACGARASLSSAGEGGAFILCVLNALNLISTHS